MTVARGAIQLAKDAEGHSDPRRKHVGYYLVARRPLPVRSGDRLPTFVVAARVVHRKAAPRGDYLGGLALATIVLVAASTVALLRFGIPTWRSLLVAVLLAVPASELCLHLLNLGLAALIPPAPLAKLDFRKGVPADARTLVVVPTMLTSLDGISEMLEALEVRYLANQDPHVHFGLLTDWADHDEQHAPGDEELALAARAGIEELNLRYAEPDRFFLFHRGRVFSRSEGRFIGWERKRGKLVELNRFLRGKGPTTFREIVGETGVLREVRYVLTLDGDTRLPPDTAARLIGTISHPLNAPQVDQGTRTMRAGHAIIQPRVSVTLESAIRSPFAKIFSAQAGVDPYTVAVSDLYQDLFDEGSYVGKGIYEVDAFEEVTDRRMCDETILSHDLLEGSYARSALAADIELFDDTPSLYLAHAMRRHRWTRGDWQVLPWLMPAVSEQAGLRRNVLGYLARWKIADNLRRSLVAPALIALLLLAWIGLLGPASFWTAVIVSSIVLPAYARLTTSAISAPRGITFPSYLGNLTRETVRSGGQALLTLIFLPHQAWVSLDATMRALWRRFVSHRMLLEWTPASVAERSASLAVGHHYRQMWASPVLALVAAGVVAWRPADFWSASPFIVGWALAPWIAARVSRPRRDEAPRLAPSDLRFLRIAARRTWRFFETFVTAADNDLPPDNFQESPSDVVAHRTSPTNIGLLLLVDVVAVDRGYRTLAESAVAVRKTLTTMGRLERFRGHLLNWYDTSTLEPLLPRYISTVDSGNLAGHLWALKQAMVGAPSRPFLGPQVLAGLIDTLWVLTDEIDRLSASSPGWTGSLRPLKSLVKAATNRIAQSPCPLIGWPVLLKELSVDADRVAALAESLFVTPLGDELIEIRQSARSLVDCSPRARSSSTSSFRGSRSCPRCRRVRGVLGSRRSCPIPRRPASTISLHGRSRSSTRARRAMNYIEQRFGRSMALRGFARSCSSCRREPKRSRETWISPFLRSGAKALLHRLQCRGGAPRSFLLRSVGERIASGQLRCDRQRRRSGRALVPPRPALGTSESGQGPLSWTGTMFEYLMPCLVMKSYAGTLLDSTYRSMIDRQMEYGEQCGVPWGTSEAAYNARDLQLNYQYSPFGVPGLGIKRGLGKDVVVAPYATALTLPFFPKEAVKNLRRLVVSGASGRYGFYESIDYTRSRVPDGQSGAIVRAFMAHHQGMLFVAIAEYLDDAPMQERFHAEPKVQATQLLLQERMPHPRPLGRAHPAGDAGAPPCQRRAQPIPHRFRSRRCSRGALPVQRILLGHGDGLGVRLQSPRWSAGHTMARGCDARSLGTVLLHPRRPIGHHVVDHPPADAHPSRELPGRLLPRQCRISQGRERHHFGGGGFGVSRGRCRNSHDQVDQLRLERARARNHDLRRDRLGHRGRGCSASRLRQSLHRDRVLARVGALLATRRRRAATEPSRWAVHVSALEDDGGATESSPLQYETDRARFLGRGRGPDAPVALLGHPLSNTVGPVLDPIFSIRRRVRIEPGASVRLSFTTAMVDTREEALRLAEKYSAPAAAQRASALAWTNAHAQLHYLNLDGEATRTFSMLASRLVFANRDFRASPDLLAQQRRIASQPLGVRHLGDLRSARGVRLRGSAHRPRSSALARPRVLAAARSRGRPRGHERSTARRTCSPFRTTSCRWCAAACRTIGSTDRVESSFCVPISCPLPTERWCSPPRGWSWLGSAERSSSRSSSSRAVPDLPPPTASQSRSSLPGVRPVTTANRKAEFFNGWGGFAEGGSEYQIALPVGTTTPAPWSNVMANARFGTSSPNRAVDTPGARTVTKISLTPWSNDAVSDGVSEAICIRDEDSGEYHSCDAAARAQRRALQRSTRPGLLALRRRRARHRAAPRGLRSQRRSGQALQAHDP